MAPSKLHSDTGPVLSNMKKCKAEFAFLSSVVCVIEEKPSTLLFFYSGERAPHFTQIIYVALIKAPIHRVANLSNPIFVM